MSYPHAVAAGNEVIRTATQYFDSLLLLGNSEQREDARIDFLIAVVAYKVATNREQDAQPRDPYL